MMTVSCGRQKDFTTIEITTSHRPPNLSAFVQDESQNNTKKFLLSSSRINEYEVDANNQEELIADYPVAQWAVGEESIIVICKRLTDREAYLTFIFDRDKDKVYTESVYLYPDPDVCVLSKSIEIGSIKKIDFQ